MIYVDTSALLKRYITERASNDFDELLRISGSMEISRLTVTEMRCALARRRRTGQIDPTLELAAIKEFRIDILDGILRVTPVTDAHIIEAYALIESIPDIPLRTLDAVHLAIARDVAADAFATSDTKQADAARALGFAVYDFSLKAFHHD